MPSPRRRVDGVHGGVTRRLACKVAEARRVSPFAAELSALSERQLASLGQYLASRPPLPFPYLTIHGPAKDRRLSEGTLVAELCGLAERADAIVMHPDTIEKPRLYCDLGRKLLIENMDARKEPGKTPDELASIFAELPEAGFCLDIAHAGSIDPDNVSGVRPEGARPEAYARSS